MTKGRFPLPRARALPPRPGRIRPGGRRRRHLLPTLVVALLATGVAVAAPKPAPQRDGRPPTVPQGQRISKVTARTITMRWRPATDDVAIAAYEVWLNGRRVGRTAKTSFVYSGLTCGRTYTVGLVAADAAGNRSDRRYATGPARTASCPAPSVRPRSPAPPAAAPSSAPAVGAVVELAGSVSPASFLRAVASKGPGEVTVRPARGADSFVVSGKLTIRRAKLHLVGARIEGGLEFAPGANGSSFSLGSASSVNLFGADDVTVRDSTFDGGGTVAQSFIHDEPAGSTPDRFRILGNTFRNFRGSTPDIHSEALFVGYSTDGLIANNTFVNNGNTSHIFFTWWGAAADPGSSYPRNICVRGNRFGTTAGAYFAVNIRAEIPASAGIDVEPRPSNVITSGIGLSANPAIVRAC